MLNYVGGSLCVDFLLKNEGIIIEVKKMCVILKVKDIGSELLIDF